MIVQALHPCRALCMTIIACALVLLCGCSQAPELNNSTSQSRDIIDSAGRTVTVPQDVERVATLGSSARLVTYAGATHLIVGVTEMDQKADPGMPYTVVNKERFASLPVVGSGATSNIAYAENLVSLMPDVIFTTGTGDEAQALQDQIGIPVVALAFQDMMFDQEFYTTLTILGDICGTRNHTDALIVQLTAWHYDLIERTADIPQKQKPTVYSGAVSFRGPHGFEGTYASFKPYQIIGAKNVADETGVSGAQSVELEKISQWNPDIIFLNPVNMNLVHEQYLSNPAYFESLRAVQTGQVYSQPSYNFNGTNIELAIASTYYAGKILYPEQFQDVEIEAMADEIFEAMLGVAYYHELKTAQIDFKQIALQ